MGRTLQESAFRGVFEGAPDAMVIVDERGVIVLVNAQAERLFGHARHALIGQTIEVLVPAPARVRHREHRGRYTGEARVREMGSGLELYAVRRDGTEFPVEISLSPLDTDDGRFVMSAIRDITERRRAREKDVLLKEIHHRVKNNLQVVSSVLRLHADRLQDPIAQAAFEEAQRRVGAIALLHDTLHSADESGPLDLRSYTQQLVDSLVRVAVTPARLKVDVDEVRLTLDQAMPCGLIMSELISNALGHAFPAGFEPGSPPLITVQARRDGGDLVVSVDDNGVGLPAQRRTGSLGLELVSLLCRQLRGTLTMHVDGGTHIGVRFPIVDADARRGPRA